HFTSIAAGVNAAASSNSQPLTCVRVTEQLVQPLRQMLRILRPVQKSATGSLKHFGKRSMLGLHNGYACGERFEHKQSLGLLVSRRNGEHIQRCQKAELALAIHFTDIFKRITQ